MQYNFVTHQLEGVPVFVYTDNDRCVDLSMVDEDGNVTGEVRSFGWHGLDVPPCPGEWIADRENGRGAIVLLDIDDEELVEEALGDLPDGWDWDYAELPEGWFYVSNGGEWRCVVIQANQSTSVVKIVGIA